jgi:hypothetical protein
MKTQTGIRGIAYSFFNLSARWGWVFITTPQLLYSWERDVVPIVQEVGSTPRPVWQRVENLA